MNRCLLRLAAMCFLMSAPIALWAPSASAQAAVEAGDEEARSLFEAGRAAYTDGRFEEALGHFRRSYELSHRPQLLYNIGQCQDRLRRDAEAVATFEEFLSLLPDSPQHTEVAARLEILRAAVERGEATEAATETETETVAIEAPAPPVVLSEPDPAPWVVLGVGGAVAVAGAILLGVGYANVAAVENAMNVPFSSVSGAYDSAPALTGAGWAALGLGVALAGVGLGWGLAGGGSNEHAHLRIGPTGIAVSGSF